MEDPTFFTLTVLALLLVPGPTNTLLATSSALTGFRRSLHLLLGELAGYNATILILGGLLGSRISGDKFRTALSLVAGTYLAIHAIRLWRVQLQSQGSAVRLHHVFITTLLNPKGLIFAFLIIPLDSQDLSLYLAGFSSMVVAVGGAWIGFGALVGRFRDSTGPTVIHKGASVALAVFAAVLIFSWFAQDAYGCEAG